MEKIFKAKRIDNGEWIEFSLFGDYPNVKSFYFWSKDEDYSRELIPFLLDQDTVCQFTGSKDSEGNRIFERDELRASGEIDSLAVWKNSSFCIKHKTNHSSFVKFSGIDISCYTLTGRNMHDNKD